MFLQRIQNYELNIRRKSPNLSLLDIRKFDFHCSKCLDLPADIAYRCCKEVREKSPSSPIQLGEFFLQSKNNGLKCAFKKKAFARLTSRVFGGCFA